MPLVISDDILKQAGLSECEALIEFVCRLFDAGRLSKGAAARLVQMSRSDFETELIKRDLPLIRYTEEMFEQDLLTLKRLEHWRNDQR